MKTLKNLILLFLLIGFSVSASAQQINYRKEQIFVDGKLYGYLLKTGSAWAKKFTFQNSNNEELGVANPIAKELADGYDYVYYEITFKGFPQKAEMEDNAEFAQRLARELASLNILKNDQLDATAVQKFLDKYPPNISKRLNAIPQNGVAAAPKKTEAEQGIQKANPVSTTEPLNTGKPNLNPEPTAVSVTSTAVAKPETKPDPNAGAPVATSAAGAMNAAKKNGMVSSLKVSGSSILKGTQKVGRFAVNEKAVNDKLKKTYSFYNVKNLKVADASFATPTSTECKITTTKDKKTQLVKIANDGDALKALASWLIRNRYL